MRTYTGTGERGEKQAIGNVRRKIASAASMRELLDIVRDNRERFVDESGKTLPIIKEFIDTARSTEAGKKDVSGSSEGRGEDKQKRKERSDKKATEDTVENKDIEPQTPKVDYEKREIKQIEKNMYNKGDSVVVNGSSGEIIETEMKNEEPIYTVKFDDGTTNHFKEVSLEPYAKENAQKSIEEANPVNRQKKTIEVSGTVSPSKDDGEVLVKEGVSWTDPELIKIPLNVEAYNKEKVSGEVSALDYTKIDQREVMLTPYSKFKDVINPLSIKPRWMPEINRKSFQRNSHSLIFEEIGEDRYIVPTDQSYRKHGMPTYTMQEKTQSDVYSNEYSVMTLAQVAATQDFYRKASKSALDRKHEDKMKFAKEKGFTGKVKKERLKMLNKNKMLYDQQYISMDFREDVDRKNIWSRYGILQNDLKQKTIDMDLMREEIDNSFSKGRETSYGDSNTSNVLEGEYGVKLKRQDGSDIVEEDVKYLSNALSSIKETFGVRKSMNENFGLKLSFAKGTAMHARKAVGIFIPNQRAIGISDGKGLKKKDPLTGETKVVDYGDENFGGFVLSHEYAHMMDYYVGKQTGEWYASDKKGSTANEIASVFRSNMNVASTSDYINRTCECFARALEQYHAMETAGDSAKSFNEEYVKTGQYVNKEVYENQIKPLVKQFMVENDSMLKAIEFIW
jgi:hypothetical protein